MSAETSHNPAYLLRTLVPAVKRASGQFKGVLINGMHGAGKHTLLAALSDARPCVSLLTNRERQLAQDDPEAFLTTPPLPVTIEEFQRAHALSCELKTALDDTKDRGRLWLTASERLGYRNPLEESLAGRLAFYDLFPLSLYELAGQGLGQKPWKPTGTLTRGTLPAMTAGDVWERIWFGSMPGLNPLVP